MYKILLRLSGTRSLLKYKQTANMSSENSEPSQVSWCGVPLSVIYGSDSPWDTPEFPLVTPGYNHTVLYHIPSHGELPDDIPPKPRVGHDKWDQDYVRMPCSSQSLYPCEDSNGKVILKKRWELIENALWKPIRNVDQLASAILSYNTKFKNAWRFTALKKLFNEHLEEEETQYFFDVTLPEMAKLALALPKLVQAPIPLLKRDKSHSISLSQQQISSLLANAFFCTFPRRNATKRTSEYAQYPFINFNRLFENGGSSHVLEKLKCLCYYFRRVCTQVPTGVLTFSRRRVPHTQLPSWPESDTLISSIPLHIDAENTIEDAAGLIQVDFANKYLGGGVLGHGCVQEEIRFVICPELMVSMLFTEALRFNEALIMIGTERYSDYSGYGHTFTWTGGHRDATPADRSRRKRCVVLAIDAVPFGDKHTQYRRDMLTRELNKAWVGFSYESSSCPHVGIASGNWGCGAFGGDASLKALLQIMAAAAAGRGLAYYSFGDKKLRNTLYNIVRELTQYNVTVGQLFKYILKCKPTENNLYYHLHVSLLTTALSTKKPPQAMDTSTSADEVHEIMNSPDLFTPENTDDSLIEIKIEKDKPTTSQNLVETQRLVNNDSFEKNQCLENNEGLEKNQSLSKNSRLIDEMQKLDEQSGSLNLSGTQKSPFKLPSDAQSNNDSRTDTTKVDPTAEMKKKISRKITDYFSKKS